MHRRLPLQFVGTEGSIAADPIHQGLSLTTDRQPPHAGHPFGPDRYRVLVGAPVWMAQEWVDCLDRGESLGPGVDQGVLVTETICAIEFRSYTGRTVDLNVPNTQTTNRL